MEHEHTYPCSNFRVSNNDALPLPEIYAVFVYVHAGCSAWAVNFNCPLMAFKTN